MLRLPLSKRTRPSWAETAPVICTAPITVAPDAEDRPPPATIVPVTLSAVARGPDKAAAITVNTEIIWRVLTKVKPFLPKQRASSASMKRYQYSDDAHRCCQGIEGFADDGARLGDGVSHGVAA